jgi:hypothetical protein
MSGPKQAGMAARRAEIGHDAAGSPAPSPLRRSVVMAMCVASLATLASGCGAGDQRARVRTVTERFLAAVAGGDGRAACAELSPDARSELESQEQQACARAVGGLDLHSSTIQRVQVFVTNAKVDLRNGDSLFLAEGAEGWRLSAIGCQVVGDKPADRPYDCELEA